MKMSRQFLVAFAVVVLVALAGGIASAQDTTEEFDVGGAVLNPALIYVLKDAEAQDPSNTLFKVEEAGLTIVSSSGSQKRNAEFLPLETTVRVQNLYFQKALGEGLFTIRYDYGSSDDARALLRYDDPDLGRIDVKETRVLHRTEQNPRGVTQYTDAGDTLNGAYYQTKWDRTEASLFAMLAREPRFAVTANFDNQSRRGANQHTFFQLHRLNCTDCHTYSATRGMQQNTQGYQVGLSAAPIERTYFAARLGQSDFDNESSRLFFNYGGPFGYSLVTGNAHSRDENQTFLASGGGENYRLMMGYWNVDRRNDSTGNTLNAKFFTGQGMYQPTNWVQVVGGYSSDDQVQSLSSNLSYNRDRLFLEANFLPAPELYATARIGQNETRYTIQGNSARDYRDNYYELRAGYRPTKDVRFRARFRASDYDNPYFPTDPTASSLLEASASWSPSPLSLGINYRFNRESNNIFANSDETLLGYVNAAFESGWGGDVSYSQSDINSNAAYAYYLDDPLGQLRLLQTGLPYSATLRVLNAGLTIPLGESGWRLRPYYRWSAGESSAQLLPNWPNVVNDSRLDVAQSTAAVRIDLPAWDDNRLGVGWEHQQWYDYIRSGNDGAFDLWMINYSTRY